MLIYQIIISFFIKEEVENLFCNEGLKGYC